MDSPRAISETVRLVRIFYGKRFTLGRLLYQTHAWCTLEPPWKNNEHNVSCIPDGTYAVRPGVHHPGTPSAYPVPELWHVPNRTEIEIHRLNFAHNTQGCIGIGLEFGALAGEMAILDSDAAWVQFFPLLGNAFWSISVQPMLGLPGTL